MSFFDEIAQQHNQIIKFTSMATGISVEFPAFITQFSDGYNISWGGGTNFGRTDPIKHYQSTSRNITAAFDIVSRSREVAIKNFQQYTQLIRMTYPAYGPRIGGANKVRTIKAAPLFRIRYANYISSPKSEEGLLGCMQGVSFNPKFESGHFISPTGELLPMIYSLSFTFEPLHELPLGFDVDSSAWLGGDDFPYKQEVFGSLEPVSASPEDGES
tara:strand:+ start:766 stop:1410 length:645 start_codon:yes stop_codon:yes gene_type:complete